MVVCDKGHHSKLGFASFSRKQSTLEFILKNNLSNKQLKYPKLPKDYDEDEDDTQDSKPAAAKVARVSLDGKSTKAKKVTKPESKKSNNPITSFFPKKDAADSDDESKLSCEQSSSIGY
jgi:hypothetical protein